MLQPEDLILEKDVAILTGDEAIVLWALEVASGASIAGKRALAAMKQVDINVASNPFMTLAYTDVNGGLVIISADDPGIHSSQNEQDNRYYAKIAKFPLLGFLSDFLPISINSWENAVKDIVPSKVLEINMNAFKTGRSLINNF